MDLKEIFETAGITGHQMTSMDLSQFPGEAIYGSFQDLNRENTAKLKILRISLTNLN
jgi:hypothetical protein